ncbi:MAG: hypothetical protein LBC40_08800 [Dysgonamonadaceae bacterium]|jgi:hypothetical protein|nr:hypothetical protein [Dysgonamonadaceae bacterium]
MLRFKEIMLCVGGMCLLFGGCTSSQPVDETAVRTAVINQMATYPRSTLKDLYKNFFQDRFGPGHLIRDTAAAGNYLRDELASFDASTGAYYESTGWEGHFYRVNLSAVKENRVPYDVYFNAFIRSVNGIVPPSIKAWEKEWLAIEAIIRSMNLPIAGYGEDQRAIAELLKQGKYVMHHSQAFEANYTPHYRMIEKTIFEKEIRPLLPEKH